MSLHFLDPDREPRECPQCRGRCKDIHGIQCYACHGTGRLGIEGAEPEIEVCEFLMNDEPIGFFWRRAGDDSLGCWCGDPNGPTTVTTFTTEQAALAAARAAHNAEVK